MRGLRVERLHKTFGSKIALHEVSFEVPSGEILAVLGPSGSGKSTLLWIIAGLQDAERGNVFWDGESVSDLPVHARGFGLMFQDYALFPHMNVFENVGFGLRMKNWQRTELDERVRSVLELVGLSGFADRDVLTLSGGEQQRVALARALAPQPRLLMLDEPLGALDRSLRERLMLELRQILRSMRQTAIYVTHDQEEAFSLADRVVVLEEGKVAQSGSPQGIYHHPACVFVAHFLGLDNILDGVLYLQDGKPFVDTHLGRWQLNPEFVPDSIPDEAHVKALLRPDVVTIGEQGPCILDAELVERTFRGNSFKAVVAVDGIELRFEFPAHSMLPMVGDRLKLSFDSRDAVQVLQP